MNEVLHADDVASRSAQGARSWAARNGVVAGAILAVLIGLIVHVSPWLAAGLGDSHDGYNAAMWGLGARGAVEDPIGNRLGGIHPDGFEYANHPPLLVWSLIPVTAVADGSALGLRLVPLLASIAAIGMLAALLIDAAFSRFATAGGILLAGSTAMFLSFGAMVDTPVLGLPFALGAIWVGQRSWQGRPPPTWLAVAAAALAAIAGWQAFLAAALAAVFAAVIGRKSQVERRAAGALACGAAGGLAVDLVWTWWVYGGLTELLDQGISRSEMDTGSWFSQQVENATNLFGPFTIAILLGGAIILIVRPQLVSDATNSDKTEDDHGQLADGSGANRSARPLFLLMTLVVIGYALLFRHGAWAHSYWNYYGIALIGVATAVLLQVADRSTRSFSPVARMLVLALVTASTIVVAVVSWGTRSLADFGIRTGLEVVPLIEELPAVRDPRSIGVATLGGDPVKPWLRWTTGGQSLAVERSEVAELDPDQLVLVTLPLAAPRSTWAGTSATSNGHYALIPAGELEKILNP